ncbi:MAG TPA: hypothetical protein VM529_18850, partial [Gemmata sp.]|nr:hypothetical protein [Gemmata sp.]
MRELPSLIAFVRGCAGDLMMLCHAQDRGKAIRCPSCGSTVVVREDVRFGRAEWDTCTNHVYLRESLELLGVPVSRRTRRLTAAALARRLLRPHAQSVVWEAVAYAETEADNGKPLPERESLWARLIEFYGESFPID